MGASRKEPVICFGQQPCGFLPRRLLVAKIHTARRIQEEVGGRIVFFYHDSDHDPRESKTILRECGDGAEHSLNFRFENKLQKKYSPYYAKRVLKEWRETTARQLPKFLDRKWCAVFEAVEAENAADFCLEMYRAQGLLEGIEVARSGDPAFRRKACAVDDFFVDVAYAGELVRARCVDGRNLRLHCGGNAYIDLPEQDWDAAQVSPARDTRLCWMQSVVQCTHYVVGLGEVMYLNPGEHPGIEFIRRDEIEAPNSAYTP